MAWVSKCYRAVCVCYSDGNGDAVWCQVWEPTGLQEPKSNEVLSQLIQLVIHSQYKQR